MRVREHPYLIQPLPTLFNHQWFRSRLEARWAVVFYELGLIYHYEDQGYFCRDQKESLCYLPDFRMPPWGHLFVEIKPDEEEAAMQGAEHCLFFSQLVGPPVLLLAGHPWPGEYMADLFHDGDLIMTGILQEVHRHGRQRFTGLAIIDQHDRIYPLGPLGMCSLQQAMIASRETRFESRRFEA